MTKLVAPAALMLALASGCGSSGSGSGSDPLGNEGIGDAGAVKRDAKADSSTSDAGVTPRATNCRSGETDDYDKDGFTRADGDCDDCRPEMNPGAYDFTNDDVDNDCSGSAAKASDKPCDGSLAIDSTRAEDAARAIGLCSFASEASRAQGVVSARFTNSTGTGELSSPLSAGLLPTFGAAKPSDGDALLALSSGVARAPNQPGYTAACDTFGATCPALGLFGCTGGGAPPSGYPKEASSCQSAGSIFQSGTQVYNQAALELKIRVPNNAESLSFDSIFYTLEYPDYVCSQYNDFYVVFKEPKPDGVTDGNIVFDSNNDPIGVNTGLLTVCDPASQNPEAQKKFDCANGTALLKNTGYGAGESACDLAGGKGGASTGWLHTTAPVKAGEIITIRFAIWDTNDPNLDSTVLIDNFKWSSDGAEVGTTPVLVI
jgi:hypothetical protein